jgi:hypothetical protein
VTHENILMTLLCHYDLLDGSEWPPAAPSVAPCDADGITYRR